MSKSSMFAKLTAQPGKRDEAVANLFTEIEPLLGGDGPILAAATAHPGKGLAH